MNASQIKGLAVRAPTGTPTRQTVDNLVLDREERNITALLLLDQEDGVMYVLAASDVESVGDREVVPAARVTPVPYADQPQYQTLPTLNSILMQDAVAEDGKLLGKVSDAEIDTTTWRVTSFDVVDSVAGALRDGPRRIPSEYVIAGEKNLIVRGGN